MVRLISLLLVLGAAKGPLPPDQPALPPGLLGPAGSAAPAPATDGIPPLLLTFGDAMRLGLIRDRLVRIGHLDAITARAQVTAATAVYQPSLGLKGTYNRYNTTSQGSQQNAVGGREASTFYLHVEQLLFDTAQGLFSIYQARQAAKAVEYTEIDTQLTAAQRIATDFYEVVRQQHLEKLDQELLVQAQWQLEQAKAKLATGTGTKLDQTRTEVAVKNAAVNLAAVSNKRRNALAKLRYDLVLPAGQPLEISDSDEIAPVETDLNTSLREALRQRPAIQAAAANLRAKGHALTAASIARFVSLKVTGSYDIYLQSSAGIQNQYLLGATVSIPLWDGQTGRMNETIAVQAVARAREQYFQQLEQAALAVEQSHLNWDDAVQRLAAADEAVRLATDSLRQTEESYGRGVASMLDITDARAAYAQAQSNRIQAKIDRDLAAVSLRLAVGRFPLAKSGQGESR